MEGLSTNQSTHQDQSKPQNMDSILEWQIMRPYRRPICLFNDNVVAELQTQPLLSNHYKELSRLASKYIVGVHLKNTILDLTELDRLISCGREWPTAWSPWSALLEQSHSSINTMRDLRLTVRQPRFLLGMGAIRSWQCSFGP